MGVRVLELGGAGAGAGSDGGHSGVDRRKVGRKVELEVCWKARSVGTDVELWRKWEVFYTERFPLFFL